MNELFNIISLAGTFALAISGALTAMNKKLDPFGVLIIAFATAVGGGTLRDVLISNRTAFWLTSPEYTYFIVAGTFFAILFRKKLGYLRKTLMLFDTIGLALFTVVGVEVGLQHSLGVVACIALGTITGAFGGVLRDIFVNDIPVVFRKEIYATVSILGGIIYHFFHHLNINLVITQLATIVVIISLRLLVVYFGWSFPIFNHSEES